MLETSVFFVTFAQYFAQYYNYVIVHQAGCPVRCPATGDVAIFASERILFMAAI